MKNEEWAAQTERRAELARAMLRCSQTSTKSMGCANRTQSRACSSYAEVQPDIDEVNGLRESCGRENRMAILHSSFFTLHLNNYSSFLQCSS